MPEMAAASSVFDASFVAVFLTRSVLGGRVRGRLDQRSCRDRYGCSVMGVVNSLDAVPHNAEQHEKAGVLLASLQRVYGAGQSRGTPALGEPARDQKLSGDCVAAKASAPMYNSAIDLLETVFDVSELDPLPYIERRPDRLVEGLANRPIAAPALKSDVTTAAIESPPDAAQNSEFPRHDASPPGCDRRRLPRRESDCAVLVRAYTGGERLSPEKMAWHLHAAKIKGQLVDVSMSGVALYLSDPLTPGTQVVLRIANRVLDRHVDSAATVLRSRQEGEQGHSVVCRFEKNLTFEQIHLIGRSLFASTIV
jgi:hypothetical protein